ncbi:MAG: hypothetical protein ACR2LK_03275 [Solirubrobacteraceae bacterium]
MTRVAITTILVSCALAFGSASQALAVSALSTSTDSGSLQYGGSQNKPELQNVLGEPLTGSQNKPETQNVLGEPLTGSQNKPETQKVLGEPLTGSQNKPEIQNVLGVVDEAPTGSQNKPDIQNVLGVRDESPTGSKDVAAQTSRQLAAGDLPFTGFSALAVVFVGLLLIATGLGLRRRTLLGRES